MERTGLAHGRSSQSLEKQSASPKFMCSDRFSNVLSCIHHRRIDETCIFTFVESFIQSGDAMPRCLISCGLKGVFFCVIFGCYVSYHDMWCELSRLTKSKILILENGSKCQEVMCAYFHFMWEESRQILIVNSQTLLDSKSKNKENVGLANLHNFFDPKTQKKSYVFVTLKCL